MDKFARCMAVTLRWEGGWSDHPNDPGGPTMKGITIATFRQWRGRPVTKAELRAISDDEVRAIYRREYWDKVRGDDLPPGFDLLAFDAAVNSGPGRGPRWLQQALGVPADGRIGPATIAAANSAGAEAITAACQIRLAFLRGRRTWPTFGRGWERRVNDIERSALHMVSQAARPLRLTAATPAPVQRLDRSPLARLLRSLAEAMRNRP